MPVSQAQKVLEWNLVKEQRNEDVGFKMQKVMCNRKLLGDLCIFFFSMNFLQRINNNSIHKDVSCVIQEKKRILEIVSKN